MILRTSNSPAAVELMMEQPLSAATTPVLKHEQEDQRISQGQCPQCGQQLYQMQSSSGSSKKWLLLKKKSSSRGTPLTIPGMVERGHCLICSQNQNQANADHTTTATEETNSCISSSPKNIDPNPTPSLCGGDDDQFQFSTVEDETDDDNVNPENSCGAAKGVEPRPQLHTDSSDDFDLETCFEVAASIVPHIPAGRAVYQGPTNSSGQKEGIGEMVWSNGDVYRGSFVADERHGHGVLYFGVASGSNKNLGEYVGDWQNNYMHGHGTRRYANGDVYVGEYEKNQRHGNGRFYYANGDLYWGPWQHDQLHCTTSTEKEVARYYYASGQRFEGTIQHNKRVGKGKVQRTDGRLDIFQYINDERVGQGVRFSAKRTKAWRLWKSNNSTKMWERKRISMAEAVSLVYEIDVAAANYEMDMNQERSTSARTTL